MKIPCTQTFNRGYLVKRAKKELEAHNGGDWRERACIWFKDKQGETFNNVVTAVGTSCVAPIFIIHNPLANEDRQTKEYTAARQPISALITLAAQVPIMKVYNNWVDKMAVKYHFDRCDLAGAPVESYIKDGLKQDYKDYLYKKSIGDPEAVALSRAFKTKKELNKYFYLKRKDQAFYDEKQFLRESVRKGQEPEYLLKSYVGTRKKGIEDALKNAKNWLPEERYIRTEDMVSRNDIKDAGRELISEYFHKNFGVNIKELNGLPNNVSIDSMDSFKQLKVKRALNRNNIDFSKEHKNALKEIIKEQSATRARKNVAKHLIREARLKLYTHKIYTEAKEEMKAYRRQLLLDGVPKAEKAELLAKKDIEILTKIKDRALAMIDSAPQNMPRGSVIKTLTVDTIVPTKEELDTFISKVQDKLVAESPNERKIKYLRTSEGSTFKELYKSVQVKRWLVARINNSENYLSDFKQKSGILVGLAILPFTCGLLNWAYPRIMEEWFPHLANAKKASAEQKEAK